MAAGAAAAARKSAFNIEDSGYNTIISRAGTYRVRFHNICLRSRPVDPDVVCPLVSSNVENSDQMTE